MKEASNTDYPFAIETQDGVRIVRIKELLVAIILDIKQGAPASVISYRFHNTVSQIVSRICQDLSHDTGIRKVALSGGVFQNRLLLNLVTSSLSASGLTPLLHSRIPCNDGGISLGQAVVAHYYKAGSQKCV
jgi:hydrogenase maturation protein HypF